MNYKKYFLLTVLFFNFFCTSYYKPKIYNWKKARNIYSNPKYKNAELDIINIEKSKRNTEIKIINNKYSSNKIYFYNIDYSGENNYLYIYNERDYILKLYFPNYKYRPIFAKWINSKLLFIEIYFNPHYGMYFIYDVENELFIVSELQNDGLDAYNKYNDEKKDIKQQ